MIRVVCRKSKKGYRFVALEVNGVLCCFDFLIIEKITGLSYDYLQSMSEGDSYEV